MKNRILAALSLAAFALSLVFGQSALAQFVPGQILAAAQLNSAFENVLALSGGALTGPLTVPTLTVTGAPIAIASGGTGAATATGATSQLQYLQGAAGSVARTLTNKFQDTINLKDFGGPNTCNGTNNDDAAMTSAFAAIAPGLTLTLPSGTCTFTTPKVLPLISNGGIRGAGSGQSTLLYTGTNTTSDLILLGDGTTSLTGWNFSGFTIQSSTKMTSGAALHVRRLQYGNNLIDVNAGSLNQASINLWRGIWLDNVNVFKYDIGNQQVQEVGVAMNGAASSDEGSDIFLDNLVASFSGVGFQIGGGQGGVYFGKVLAFYNNVNYRVDNSFVARKNREIFFSSQTVSDGNTNYGFHFNDALTSNAPITLNAHIGSAGTFGTGGVGVNVYVQKWPNGRIVIGPGQLYNATADSVRVDDASTIISIDQGRQILNNGGYAVNATVPDSNIYNYSQYMASNASGNQSANVTSQAFTGNFGVSLFYTPGTQRAIQWAANGVPRWQWFTDGSSEPGSGSNGGSNMALGAYSDTGTYLGTYALFVRATGALTLSGSISHGAQEIDKSYAYSTPATGATVTLASGTGTAIINPSATLATLTITLPGCTSAYDGSIARYSSTQAITALTLGAASGSVAAPATSLAAGAGHGYLCRGANTTWYPLY
ncbi:hypothetical protein [Burkholderia sp. YIM B11467]